MTRHNIILRLDAEYINIGDKAIDMFALEFFSKIGRLTIIAPDYENFKKYIYPELKKNLGCFHSKCEVSVLPDIIDSCRPKHFKRKLLRNIEFLLNLIGFLGISALPLPILVRSKNPLINLAIAIRKADMLVFSGGGYLNEAWWKSTLIPLLVLSISAKLQRIKVVLGPSSIGPVISRKFKLGLRLLFKQMDLAYVREPMSLIVVKDVSPKHLRVRLAKDWGLLRLLHCWYQYIATASDDVLAIHIRPPLKKELKEKYYKVIWNKIIQLKPKFIQIIIIAFQEEEYSYEFLDFIKNKGFDMEHVEIIKAQTYEELLIKVRAGTFMGSSFHFTLLGYVMKGTLIPIIIDDYHYTRVIGLRFLGIPFKEIIDFRG
ncbi:MAG: polysaccharide pyruvyl transferase family protein [Candidatus Bathyarchaeia archaeon]